MIYMDLCKDAKLKMLMREIRGVYDIEFDHAMWFEVPASCTKKGGASPLSFK